MAEFDRNGWKLFYEDSGGDGPPVLLIHGLLMDHTMFGDQVAALKDRYRLITPDLRAHGASEHRAEEYTQWDLMEDNLALLESLGIDRAMWGGVSQGGFQSLRAALRHPGRVAGLVLIDTQAGAEDENRAPMYEAFAEVVATDGWSEHILENSCRSMFGTSASEELMQHWKDRWAAQATDDARQSLWSVTRREDITDRLKEIEHPAIVIHGEEDAAIDMERAEKLADGLPNLVEFVKVPRAGHSSTVEQPEPVTEAVERFLQKVYPA